MSHVVRESHEYSDEELHESSIQPRRGPSAQSADVTLDPLVIGPRGSHCDAASQTTHSPHYDFHTDGLARFPIFVIVWTPILILFQGVAYGAYWRLRWIERMHFLREGPLAMQLYVAFMVMSLLVSAGVCSPMYFHAVTGQMLKPQREKLILQASLVHAAFCSLPLTAIQMWLYNVSEWPWILTDVDPTTSYEGAAVLVIYLSLFSTFGILWFLYAAFTADAMQRRARATADEFLHHHSPPRHPGVRMPPTMSMHVAQQREAQLQVQRYGFHQRQQPTPSRVPLVRRDVEGSMTPPPATDGGRATWW